MKEAVDLEVELYGDNKTPVHVTNLRTDHGMHAIIKAKLPMLNRKQRRQMAARMQKDQTAIRTGKKIRW